MPQSWRLFLLCCLFAFAAPVAAQGAADAPRVELRTTLGSIVIELDRARAPVTVENFLAYAKSGHYDGTVFHRVIKNFMIQGGGMDAKLREKPARAPIRLESRNGLKNVAGAVAMARTSAPDSATSQFFIDVVDNPRLDYPSFDGYGYAVFGKVVSGMDVVEKIRAVPVTDRYPYENVPVEPVVIERAVLLK